jgi:hypothetical protein
MAKVITDVDSAIDYINTLYNFSSSAPSSGEEDYAVWLALLNVAVNLWESEEGILWNELFVKLADAADGDKTTAAADDSYSTPTDFRFSAGGYVWLGDGTSKTPYKIVKQEELQIYENDTGNWCYFLMDTSPTLEFNPNLTLSASQTINYAYYKNATKLTTGSDTFEMSDPMFAVYFALSELKKEEGNVGEVSLVQEKMSAMKLRNEMPGWLQEYALSNKTKYGFGY